LPGAVDRPDGPGPDDPRSLLFNARSVVGVFLGVASDRRAARGPLALALLVLLCAAVYVPGLATIAPVDRDECRFAQASRQMLESVTLAPGERDERVDPVSGAPVGRHAGGLVVPMVQEVPRLNKPPLVYWLQAGSAWACTLGDASADAMWMYRVPSALCACVSVLLTWRLGVRMMDARAALLGAALLAVSPMVVWDAHQARADQLLLATTTASMYALWRTLRAGVGPDRAAAGAGPWLWPVLLWGAVGLGVLAKGFITPMVVLGCVLGLCALERSWRPLVATRPLLGLVVVAGVLAPWVLAISERFGLASYAQLVWQETFVRAGAGSKEGHFAPPGTHLVLLAALLWPGSLFTLAALGWALRRVSPGGRDAGLWRRLAGWWNSRHGGPAWVAFALAWVAPSWAIFELSMAKLPHYTMPLFPALALLSARAVLAMGARARLGGGRSAGARGWNLGLVVWVLIGAGAFAAAALAPWLVRDGRGFGEGPGWWSMVAAAAIVVVGGGLLAVATRSMVRGRWLAGQWQSVLAISVVLGVAMQVMVPQVAPGVATERIVRTLAQIDPQGERPLASTYREDSMVFSTRGRVQRIGDDQGGAWLAANPRGLLVTRQPSELPPGLARTEVAGSGGRFWVVHVPQ
jgi:4-amino-4-deoxy-L-arabinose transferase-like glycosyltransferase